MNEAVRNYTLCLDLLFFVLVVFVLSFLYLIFVYRNWCGRPLAPWRSEGLSISDVVHDFYTLLLSFTLGATSASLYFFPREFYGGGVVMFLLVIVFFYVISLKHFNGLKHAVVSQELPRLPLLITVGVTLTGVVYTLLTLFIGGAAAESASLTYQLYQFMGVQSESAGGAVYMPREQPVAGQLLLLEEKGGEPLSEKRIELPAPPGARR